MYDRNVNVKENLTIQASENSTKLSAHKTCLIFDNYIAIASYIYKCTQSISIKIYDLYDYFIN